MSWYPSEISPRQPRGGRNYVDSRRTLDQRTLEGEKGGRIIGYSKHGGEECSLLDMPTLEPTMCGVLLKAPVY